MDLIRIGFLLEIAKDSLLFVEKHLSKQEPQTSESKGKKAQNNLGGLQERMSHELLKG